MYIYIYIYRPLGIQKTSWEGVLGMFLGSKYLQTAGGNGCLGDMKRNVVLRFESQIAPIKFVESTLPADRFGSG